MSTDDQNLNLQHNALKNEGCEKIFDDPITGSKIQRPGLDAVLEFARAGNVIVVGVR
ncbi:MAG: recombinase family protein [Legionella sp.]|nr:recombinase family protein [Legionella sp.]